LYSGDVITRVLQLRPADGWVNCLVRDKDGNSVSDVGLGSHDADMEWGTSSDTGAEGTCRLPILLGENTIGMSPSVEERGYDLAPSRKVVLDTPSGEVDIEFTLLPSGWPTRKYEVWGGYQDIPGYDAYFPEFYGYTSLGEADRSSTFHGTYPKYLVVTHQGLLKVDTVLGSDGTYYNTYFTGATQNWNAVGGPPDGQYALVGVWADKPNNGYIGITPYDDISWLQVILPGDVPPPRPTIGIDPDTGNLQITWEAFGTNEYTVVHSDDLTLPVGQWRPVEGITWPITATTFTNPVPDLRARYYRIKSQ